MWIFSGPVFAARTAPKIIGPNKMAVPTHTYKVVLCVHADGEKEMFGFVVPNIDKPTGRINDYTFSVKEVERLTGLDFFAALPTAEQKRLEGAVMTLPGQ
jgi:endonuclease G